MPDINLGRVKGADGITPNILIENVNTLDAGAAAYFERDPASPDTSPVFNVGIPRGASGATPDVRAGTVQTVAYGAAAEVTRRAGSSNAQPIFDFKIPEGKQGPQGVAPAQSILLTESIELGPPHANKQIIVNSTNDVTINVLNASYSPMPNDTEVEIFRMGSGAVTIQGYMGVTILGKGNKGSYTIPEQYTGAALKLLSAYDSSNNTWTLQGAIE